MSSEAKDSAVHPLRSTYTTNLPELLAQAGISLVVSTYQAGRVFIIRSNGREINTHFKLYEQPKGIAATADKLAIGARSEVWELRNTPAAVGRLSPAGSYDACYLLRNRRVTGDIDIHEMVWCGEELWCVNTRFSCLCTLDFQHSFVPRWRPPFISSYGLGDRCHLNGLGARDGRPRYITALGETDKTSGWRDNKTSGGIIMDIDNNQIIARGLSMPHSPRWYKEQLWVLESGRGAISTVDPESGKVETLTTMPGFTRGLTFWGPLAFVGLSQVRETALFSGIPITETAQERVSGVWVVHIETGEVVAFLRFDDAVQEIFAVEVLPGIRYPELATMADHKELLASSFVLPDEVTDEIDFS